MRKNILFLEKTMISIALSYIKKGCKYIDFEDDMGWDEYIIFPLCKKRNEKDLNGEDSKVIISFLKNCWNKARRNEAIEKKDMRYIPKLDNAPFIGTWEIIESPKIGDVISFRIDIDFLPCSVIGQVKSFSESLRGLTQYVAVEVKEGALKGKMIYIRYYYCGGNDSIKEKFYKKISL